MASMQKSNVLPAVIVVGVCVVGILLIALGKGGSSGTAGQVLLGVPVRESDHILGTTTAQVLVVEYADFQCPTCQVFSPMLNQLQSDEQGKVAVVYRYFPLPQHRNAVNAAKAAEAAGLQGKFWEMHDILFKNQTAWENIVEPSAFFGEYAKVLGIDTAKFASDYASNAVANRVATDEADAKRNNLTYTPTLFVQGVRITNPQTYEELKQVVEKAGGITAQ
jgi:protein-disulfide isomerase